MSFAIPTQQKALRVPAKQAPMVVDTIDVYKPEAGEILVRIEAVALGPADWKVHEFGVWVTEFPAVLGMDGAGVVVQTGEGVSNVVPGDRIIYQGNILKSRTGTFQQYAAIPAATAIKIPQNLSLDEASTLPVAVGTALNAFYGPYIPEEERSGAALTPFWKGQYINQPFVVLSGATSTGQLAIQFARLSGFSPIIVTASLKHTELLKSFGATHVLDRSLPFDQLAAEIKKIAGAPISYLYDGIGEADVQKLGYELLAPGGTLMDVMFATPELKQILAADNTSGKKFVFTHGGFDYGNFKELGREFVPKLPELLEKGEIRPNVPEYISGGLSAIPGGLARLKNGQVSGKKLVVRPQESS
ncbi:GroES-like protein [Panus rudis PR-1116 ss-1]|nr:GroES-like protein [Panus rudis PR-1116 ss-1]